MVDPSGRRSQKSNIQHSNIDARKDSAIHSRFNFSLIHDLKEFEDFKYKSINNYFNESDIRRSGGYVPKGGNMPQRLTKETIKNILLNNSVNSWYNNQQKDSQMDFDSDPRFRYNQTPEGINKRENVSYLKLF